MFTGASNAKLPVTKVCRRNFRTFPAVHPAKIFPEPRHLRRKAAEAGLAVLRKFGIAYCKLYISTIERV